MFDVSCVVVDYLLLSTDILRFRPVVLMVVNYLHQFFIYYLQGYFCPMFFFLPFYTCKNLRPVLNLHRQWNL